MKTSFSGQSFLEWFIFGTNSTPITSLFMLFQKFKNEKGAFLFPNSRELLHKGKSRGKNKSSGRCQSPVLFRFKSTPSDKGTKGLTSSRSSFWSPWRHC